MSIYIYILYIVFKICILVIAQGGDSPIMTDLLSVCTCIFLFITAINLLYTNIMSMYDYYIKQYTPNATV